MHIESLSIRNFKCFGNQPAKTTINPGLMGLVGDNGAGKSAILEALKRLFSPIANERRIQKADVHFGHGEDSQSIDEREVVIDVVFGFKNADAIPHVFNDIFFNAKDRSLKVRIALECLYKRSESFEDDIDVKIYTIRTLDDVPFGPDDERKIPLRGRATQFAELVYIPAHRDSLGVTRHALKNVLKRIERSADWDQATKDKSRKFALDLESSLNAEKAVGSVRDDLKSFWGALHDGHYDADPVVSVVATEFEQLIRELTLRFEKSPGGGQRQLEELSEGQVSLLYFALSATLHNLIWKMQAATPGELDGFKTLDFSPPPLTIFALEEPENHLSPFYLPRLISLLEKLNKEGDAQSFVTSHSTSILTRIAPRNVRYVRNCRQTLVSDIRDIPLPESGSDEDKFVTQAILANPEIYFARLIVIGEGDSERIVIPRIAQALGVPLDPSFIAFVPIGGRHAQHLWKLAAGLKIPCLTLLDFDLGRHGGGMGRVENAVNWLVDAGIPRDPKVIIPSNEQIDGITVDGWCKWLRQCDIYYSTYLDLDMMMVKAFPSAYRPTRSYDPAKDDIGKISVSVFGEKGLGNDELSRIGQPFADEELHAYKNLFKSRAKPASHYNALGSLSDQDIVNNCPEPLRALVERAKELLAGAARNPDGGAV
ncbi:AAA family ATPase [Ponticaulis sp.]|uniref:ATP-dependent nuclease n=1 Tax=Ponticaulis sp. TaxID=2020902 RepID=UPI0025F97A78|nr:AAA family ATPase [Ponticaulis sp.]